MIDTITASRLDLADLFGVNERTVAKWQAEGMPVLSRGRGGKLSGYNLAAAFRWARDSGKFATAGGDGESSDTTGQQARVRKDLAQAAEAEQRVAQRAGKLIAIEDIEKSWGGIVAAVRSKLLAMPTALSDRLHRAATMDGAAAVEALLQTAIYDALRELSSGEVVATKKAPKWKAKKQAKKRRAKQ